MGSLSSIKDTSININGYISKSFEDSFQSILNDISEILKESPQRALKEWITSTVEYNVPHGKMIRGKLVESAYMVLTSHRMYWRPTKRASANFGLLQAAFLVMDDLMDNGTTRRGQPCWYKVDNMGSIVANDAMILEHLVYQIIKKHFGHSKIYPNLLDLLLGVTFNTTLGQSLDTRFPMFIDKTKFSDLNAMQLYHSIAKLKTSYYTIYLPIALAMVLAGFEKRNDSNENRLWEEFREIALKIGTFFQIQDDYFDCFTDKEKTGKEGSDIQEGKCSWLYAKAMELSNLQQKKELKKNYGISALANVVRIKSIYLELDLPNEFLKIQRDMAADILMSIDKLDHVMLKRVLGLIYKEIFKRSH